jgi:hypothetical protein
MYKKATRLKLRFQTQRGLLSIEDLWGLKLETLESELRAQFKRMKDSGTGGAEELDFLGDKTVNPDEELRFEILKDIYKTKKAEILEAKKAAENKLEKQKLLEVLKKKQDESLEKLSEEELRKRIEALG